MTATLPASAVSLRPVTAADAELLFRVYASTREEELAPVPWTAEQKDAFLHQQFQAQSADWATHYGGADFSVVEVDGRPAGRFYVARSDREIRLVDVALLPEYRGMGIGTRLITDLLAEAAAAARSVTIHVEKFNPARRLYERMGFVVREDRGMYFFMEWQPGSVTSAGIS